jgi:hypothetical protein
MEPFQKDFRAWVAAFCQTRNYNDPNQSWYDSTYKRLGDGLQAVLHAGIQQGVIIPTQGYKFTLRGHVPSKAYTWFSKRNPSGPPYVNWEYFIQAAEYARLWPLATDSGYQIKFEHDRMDIAVISGIHVVTCIEVKESVRRLDDLVKTVRTLGKKGIPPIRGRDEDPIQKAQYLLKHKPKYFAAVSIGKRYEFSITYEHKERFALLEDLIPFSWTSLPTGNIPT